MTAPLVSLTTPEIVLWAEASDGTTARTTRGAKICAANLALVISFASLMHSQPGPTRSDRDFRSLNESLIHPSLLRASRIFRCTAVATEYSVGGSLARSLTRQMYTQNERRAAVGRAYPFGRSRGGTEFRPFLPGSDD